MGELDLDLESNDSKKSKKAKEEGVAFKDAKGLPANEHAKKLAKEKSAKSKKAKEYQTYYTIKKGKVLSVTIKPNGAYSGFIGHQAKMKNGQFEAFHKKAKAEGLWIPEEDYNQKVSQLIEELNSKK